MKKGDLIWLLVFAVIVLFLVMPSTHRLFLALTLNHPFITGFLKFFVLASLGELLAIRILKNEWSKPAGFIYRSVIWGFLGVVIVLMFDIFASGMTTAFTKGLLPGKESKLVFAFFTSTVMNLTFAPTFMAFHRFTDTYIDLACQREISRPRLEEVIKHIDWHNYVSFVVLKTLPFFWIPAHTVTFLLPQEYRVLSAALLSVALGALLAYAKRETFAAVTTEK